jgi:hypothetical protein
LGLLVIPQILDYGKPGSDSPEKKLQDAQDPRLQKDHYIRTRWQSDITRKGPGNRNLRQKTTFMIPNYNRSIPSQGKTASVAAGLAAVISETLGTISEIPYWKSVVPRLRALGAKWYPYLADAPAGQFNQLLSFIKDRNQISFNWLQGTQVFVFDKYDVRSDDFSGANSVFTTLYKYQKSSIYGYKRDDVSGIIARFAHDKAQVQAQKIRAKINPFLTRFVESSVSNNEARFQQWNTTLPGLWHASLPSFLQPFIIPSKNERQVRAWHLSLGYEPANDQVRRYPWEKF